MRAPSALGKRIFAFDAQDNGVEFRSVKFTMDGPLYRIKFTDRSGTHDGYFLCNDSSMQIKVAPDTWYRVAGIIDETYCQTGACNISRSAFDRSWFK
jgi:hypothetical protein